MSGYVYNALPGSDEDVTKAALPEGADAEQGHVVAPKAVTTADPEADPKQCPGISGTRWSTILLALLAGGAVTLAALQPESLTSLVLPGCGLEADADAPGLAAQEACASRALVLRPAAAVAALFLGSAVVGMALPSAFDKAWVWKLAGVLLVAAALVAGLPAELAPRVDPLLVLGAQAGGVLFVLLQQLVVLDAAHAWNSSLLDKTAATRFAKRALSVTSVGKAARAAQLAASGAGIVSLLGGYSAAVGALYAFYGGADPDACPDNVSIITFSLVGVAVAAVAQLRTGRGGVVPLALVAAYALFTTYSSVSLNPRAECNPTLRGGGAATFHATSAVGLAAVVASLLYQCVFVARKMVAVITNGSFSAPALTSILTGRHVGGGSTINFGSRFRACVVHANVVFASVACYTACALTNWGVIPDADEGDEGSSLESGRVSMWAQAAGAWLAVALYVVSVMLPSCRIMPRSVWDVLGYFV